MWQDSDHSRAKLGHGETARWLQECLQRAHPTNRVALAARHAESLQGEGETLFDILVEIIRAMGLVEESETTASNWNWPERRPRSVSPQAQCPAVAPEDTDFELSRGERGESG